MKVALSDFLVRKRESLQVADSEYYKRVTIRMNGNGVLLRDRVTGIEIGTKHQFVVRSGQFLLSKIDARNGAFGVVPESCEGAIITGNFWAFEVDTTKIDLSYLHFFSKTEEFIELCRIASDGTTNRRYLDETKFLSLTIPFPPIEQQRMIAQTLSRGFTQLDNAKCTEAKLNSSFDQLLIAMAHRNDLTDEQKIEAGWKLVRLGEVIQLDLDPVKVDPSDEYPNLGIYSFARGAFGKPPLSGLTLSAKTLFRVREGQFVYLKLNAYEGAYAHVPKELDRYFVTNEFPTFTCDQSRCRVEWLAAHFKLPSVWRSMSHSSKGTPTRRQRVNPDAILAHEVWLPPLKDQDRIAEVLRAKQQYDALNTFEKDAEALRRSILAKAFRGEL